LPLFVFSVLTYFVCSFYAEAWHATGLTEQFGQPAVIIDEANALYSWREAFPRELEVSAAVTLPQIWIFAAISASQAGTFWCNLHTPEQLSCFCLCGKVFRSKQAANKQNSRGCCKMCLPPTKLAPALKIQS
jgi:hypothetical protein